MRTGEPDVYAIGDIVPTPALAHCASAEGILAVEHIAGKDVRPINYDHVPNAHVHRSRGRLGRPDGEEGEGARLRREDRQVPVHRQLARPRSSATPTAS